MILRVIIFNTYSAWDSILVGYFYRASMETDCICVMMDMVVLMVHIFVLVLRHLYRKVPNHYWLRTLLLEDKEL